MFADGVRTVVGRGFTPAAECLRMLFKRTVEDACPYGSVGKIPRCASPNVCKCHFNGRSKPLPYGSVGCREASPYTCLPRWGNIRKRCEFCEAKRRGGTAIAVDEVSNDIRKRRSSGRENPSPTGLLGEYRIAAPPNIRNLRSGRNTRKNHPNVPLEHGCNSSTQRKG